METMSKAEYLAFLSAPARCGKLATVRPDGRPHVVPIWFIVDGEDLIFTSGPASVKVRNIEHNPHVAICVDDDAVPYHYVSLEGQVSLVSSDVEDCRRWATRIGGRYMGADRAAEFGDKFAEAGEWVYRLVFDKVIAYKDVVAD
ncbi:MAG: PPOX class F420-dependent oxidoreductase [Anaerolineae bacterium]|nr:PPOX class F420-dependent oxidoreductase [Anaerolineae bacterium]